MFEAASGAPLVRGMKSNPLFARAKSGFSMFSLGRDDESQVFYERSHFEAWAGSSFDVLAVEEEAYFYETALLLARKRNRAAAARRGTDAGPVGSGGGT